MSELKTSVEKVVAVTTGSALFSSVCLFLSNYNTLVPYKENTLTLTTYASIGCGVAASLWYKFRK